MSTKRLLEIKDQIGSAKTKQAEVKGQISGVEGQAKSKFKVDGLPAAKEKLGEMGDKLDQKETEFAFGTEKLEAAYLWE